MYGETIQSERLYSQVADRYETVFERAVLSESRLTVLARQWTDGRAVLDLACGTGRWRTRLTPRSYVGLDLNDAMLREARRQFPGAVLVRGDMTRLPFRDGSFDAVLSLFGAIAHLPPAGQAAMVREVHRVLRSGGVFLLTNGNNLSPFVWPVLLAGERAKVEGMRFRIHSTTPAGLAALLGQFRLAALESYDYSFVPLLPVKLVSTLLARDYRADYAALMNHYEQSRHLPGARWFGKQLVAVCEKP